MKKSLFFFVALTLAFVSCNNSNKVNSPASNNPDQAIEQASSQSAEEVLFATGDLNGDGFQDSVVIAKNEVYRNFDEEVVPAEGDGLKVFFGDKNGNYSLYGSYPVNSRPDDLYANWESITIDENSHLIIAANFRTDGDVIYTYALKHMEDDFYLTNFSMEYGTDEDNFEHYDLVNHTLVVEIDWHEMDTENYHHRTDTYELKDLPLKRLSEFKIGDEVCDFYDYVENIDEDIFEYSGTDKDALCHAEYTPDNAEGDLNGDGIDDLVVNVNNSRFAVYFKNSDGVYNLMCQGKSFDDWTETTAYIRDGNLMVYAFTESSKDYTFHYDDSGYFRLIAFDQYMDWPDGGGSYSQSFDFVNGKRTVQEDDNPAQTSDLPQIPLRVFEEIHFGNIEEIEAFYEE